jgi:hypothetical protein
MPAFARSSLSVLLASFLVSAPALAFNSPLSDEAIREAYFLGQRHDGSFARLLEKYAKRLPPPRTGPQIASIAFLTPFAQLVRFSESYGGNYSAQQAALDHRQHEEIVEISVEILFTASYGALLPASTGSRPDSPQGYRLRPYDFWKDFDVQVYEGDEKRAPQRFNGEPNYFCGEGGCTLTGATLHLEFPATAFTSDSVTVQVFPPEGPDVSVDFDVNALR